MLRTRDSLRILFTYIVRKTVCLYETKIFSKKLLRYYNLRDKLLLVLEMRHFDTNEKKIFVKKSVDTKRAE